MASKVKTVYVCTACGFESVKWVGQCPGCRAWNTLEEHLVSPKSQTASVSPMKSISAGKLSQVDSAGEQRFVSGISELDRVLGGGIVKGSVVLLCGDPGIGKSTILLQICEALGKTLDILYVSGEESAAQIKIRAGRLGVSGENVTVITETDTQAVCEYVSSNKPDLVMIDSIQTMQIEEIA
ncbi:MAG: AAA family ATPase, partial [Clostridia bacterium]|nr:AAA family ATPase [Clostridia bacterium]